MVVGMIIEVVKGSLGCLCKREEILMQEWKIAESAKTIKWNLVGRCSETAKQLNGLLVWLHLSPVIDLGNSSRTMS